MNRLILGSSSPRRKELLAKAGYSFDIITADTDETLPTAIGPDDAVRFLAFKKALAVKKKILNDPKLSKEYSHKDAVILSSDTVVFLDEILGKPADKAQCVEMISKLAGESHKVYTAVALLWVNKAQGKILTDFTTVEVKPMTEREICNYAATKEPYDKAGGYAIQGEFSRYIEGYLGSFDTVMGLPTKLILEQLPLSLYCQKVPSDY